LGGNEHAKELVPNYSAERKKEEVIEGTEAGHWGQQSEQNYFFAIRNIIIVYVVVFIIALTNRQNATATI